MLDEFDSKSAEYVTSKLYQLAEWIEIKTEFPQGIYYFGPFARAKEAQVELPGYIEDLEQEGAKVTAFQIRKGQPKKLTIVTE
ncbi:MAG: DUF1816 domain-containing protein [Hormoscilla sp.]